MHKMSQTSDESSGAEWLSGRCPIVVLADRLRGDPSRVRQLLFITRVWLAHRERCVATRP